MTPLIRITAALVMMLAVAACKETVHADLTEREANEIVAVLYAEGISASKEPLKKGLYAISVAKPDFGVALSVLTKAGLPRQSFDTIGDVFPDDSVVGTAFEERARFSFALSQELARTLTEVEGVQHARVHVVIPEKGRFADKVPPAKAALAIYHKPEFDRVLHVPQIKKLVAFSVPNLAYDDVSVSLFPAGALSDTTLLPVAPNGSAIAASAGLATGFVNMDNDLISILLIALALLTGLFFLVRLLHGLWSFVVRGVSDAN
ncbi:MAG: type III secretion inner membrane ring lipoprotein SctJ [Pseudomonadota bacterium]